MAVSRDPPRRENRPGPERGIQVRALAILLRLAVTGECCA